ncbi:MULTISPECIES: response regulator [Herpetosiphon]|uniref:response regulator n=1 Tax=Herpetosiphon TaxID=64 RepID=UPI00195DF4D7|nr:response regulator [Herpetosiphon giganteus]MBM7842515.1 DNA-binding NtrC family response regulator [Herpetosiphon giganteus]
MQTIVAYVPDLMFGIRVRDVLQQLGYQAIVADSLAAAQQALAADLGLLIVDLRSESEATSALVQAAKALDPQLPVLAFGSHVDVERQKAARAAGCDRVVANSKFSSDLPNLIATLVRPQSAG